MFRKGKKMLGLLVLVGLLIAFLAQAVWSAEKVQLNWWVVSEPKRDECIKVIINNFQQEYPDIEVNLVSIPNDPYKTKIRVAVGSDAPPDLFEVWVGEFTGKFVRAGQVLDITDYLTGAWRESLGGAVTVLTYDERIYGVPHCLQVKYMFYIRSVFDEVGVRVPQTWDEFLNVCAKLKAAGYIPIAQGNLNRWPGCHWISILNQKIVGEDQIFKDYNLQGSPEDLFTAEAYVEALAKLLSLQEKGFFSKGMNAMTQSEARALFLVEQAAMFYGGTWQLVTFGGAAGEVEPGWIDGLSAFRFPDIPEGLGNQDYILGAPGGMVVSSKTKYPEEVISLLRYFSSVESQKLWAKTTNELTVVKGTTTEETAPFALQIELARDTAEASGMIGWLDTVLEISVSTDYLNGIQAMLNYTMTPEQVMEMVRETAQLVQSQIGPITY
ncbi:MAG: extracellular solute-binding protein [Firmicutes bacterium]|nr:extracellular solute-binding protein [Bacillota bacterium]